MSGTSMDGLDLVYVKFTKMHSWDFKILAARTYNYNSNWLDKLNNSIYSSPKSLHQLDKEYSTFIADLIMTFIKEFKINNLEGVG